MRRWRRWRRRQRSALRYAMVPGGTVIVASGLTTLSCPRLLELRRVEWF